MKSITYLDLKAFDKPPVNCDFSIGDEVVFTNDYGVPFYGYTVIGFSNKVEQGRFIYLNKQSYGFAISPDNLTKMSAEKQMQLLNDKKRYSGMANLLKLSDKPLKALVNGYEIVWNSYFEHFTLAHDEIGVIDHHNDFDYICESAVKG